MLLTAVVTLTMKAATSQAENVYVCLLLNEIIGQ